MKIKRFADSKTIYGSNHYPLKEQNYTHWYETIDGVRKMCDEYFIDKLYSSWLVSKNPKREDNNSWAIFVFDTPFDFDL